MIDTDSPTYKAVLREAMDKAYREGQRDAKRELREEARAEARAEVAGALSPGSVAEALLVSELTEGARPLKDLLKLADRQGISERTLRYRAEKLGILRERERGRSVWTLP